MSKINFEKSIEKLEGIVKSLEDTTISLDESLKLYESGIEIIASCNRALEEAKQRIQIVSSQKASEKEAEAE